MVVVILSPLAFPDWPSATFFSASQIEEPKQVDFLQLYIPSNFFFSLSNAIVPGDRRLQHSDGIGNEQR
jgi:hypothetical protein